MTAGIILTVTKSHLQ